MASEAGKLATAGFSLVDVIVVVIVIAVLALFVLGQLTFLLRRVVALLQAPHERLDLSVTFMQLGLPVMLKTCISQLLPTWQQVSDCLKVHWCNPQPCTYYAPDRTGIGQSTRRMLHDVLMLRCVKQPLSEKFLSS